MLLGGNTPSPTGSVQAGAVQHGGQPATPATPSSVDISTEDEPLHFRNLAEIYQETSEVELALDSEGEALLAELEEPTCYVEAATDPEWAKAMDSEIQSIEKNRTWTRTKLPAGHRPISLKWVFKLKKNAEGEIIKHKARLVAKGYV